MFLMDSKAYSIEEYIDGTLSGMELDEFNAELVQNPELLREVEFRSEVNKVLRDYSFFEIRKLLKKQLNKGFVNYSSVINIKRKAFRTWHLVAASFALLLTVGGLWYIFSLNTSSTERFVNMYYNPSHLTLQVRSGEIDPDEGNLEAFNFYQENNFKCALEYLDTLENKITARFYSGIWYMEYEMFDLAIDAFEYIVRDNDNLFVEQAEWYLGFVYLMNNRKKDALKQFTKISVSESFYKNQASEILKYLN